MLVRKRDMYLSVLHWPLADTRVIQQVAWVGLNGIQFRRIGGDGWQYQMLAKRILVEMRL
jgi:hypothetical protein